MIAGRYRIEAPIGKGGMGAVFVVFDTKTEQRLALKILTEASQSARDGFELEGKVHGRTGSQHIVRVFDLDTDPEHEHHFIVMERLEGRNLEQLMGDEGPRSPAQAVDLIEQLARGLDAAHACEPRAIIHRDIKPENLFLANQPGTTPILKILDFGLAKSVSASVAQSGEVKGTALYMAPEQWNPELGAPSPKTDVWALGLVTFFLLTGREYWKHASAGTLALFREVVTEPLVSASDRYEALEQRDPPWPAEFDDWFAKAVNREPQYRYDSAGAAARALRRALLPQAAGTASDVDRTAPRRSPQTALAHAATVPQGAVARDSTPPARARRGWLVLTLSVAALLLGTLTVLAATRFASEAERERPNTVSAPQRVGSSAARPHREPSVPPASTRESASPERTGVIAKDEQPVAKPARASPPPRRDRARPRAREESSQAAPQPLPSLPANDTPAVATVPPTPEPPVPAAAPIPKAEDDFPTPH